jgi:hypothetical protein
VYLRDYLNSIGSKRFVLTLDHEEGKGYLQHRDKIARDSYDIYSNSTWELGNAVNDGCLSSDAEFT